MRTVWAKDSALGGLVVAVLCLPLGALAGEIGDVALKKDGLLVGRVAHGAGKQVAGQPVQVWQGSTMVASTVTGEDGSFAVQGLRGGCYVVESNQDVHCYRVWADGTAPPTAQAEARLSTGQPRTEFARFQQRTVGAVLNGNEPPRQSIPAGNGPPREGNPGGNGHGNGPGGGLGHYEHGNGRGVGHYEHGLGHGYGHPHSPCGCD